MRSTIVLGVILFYGLCAVLAQPANKKVTKKDKIWSLLLCVPPAPASTYGERALAARLKFYYTGKWSFHQRPNQEIPSLNGLISQIQCELGENFATSVATDEWNVWLQMMSDLTFTFWCMKKTKFDNRCRKNVAKLFGRDPSPVSPEFLKDMERRVQCKRETLESQVEVLEGELAKKIDMRRGIDCAYLGLEHITNLVSAPAPQRKPNEPEEQSQQPLVPPDKEHEQQQLNDDKDEEMGKNSGGQFLSVFRPPSISWLAQSVQKSVTDALNQRAQSDPPGSAGWFSTPRIGVPRRGVLGGF